MIFREYDIRGIVNKTLFTSTAYDIGRVFIEKGTVVVGFDGRLTSEELEKSLIEGLTDSGVNVVRIGLCPTPMLYFTAHKLNADGAIMITGSHNPPDHNGFKMMRGKKSVYGAEIQELRKKIEGLNKTAPVSTNKGEVKEINIADDYISELLSAYSANTNGKKLKIAWDSGNGSSGKIVEELTKKLYGEHVLLNTNIDGTFPVHHPDPTVAENLNQLIFTVIREKCDVGVAFDGDGDRIGAVDNKGRIIWGDQLLSIFAEEVLHENPNTTIIADVKASNVLFDRIAELGGKPIMYKTGHSLIKAKMAETGALLAGEMSGHIFFKDKYYGFDDGIYAAVRLLDILANTDELLSDKLDKLPKTFSTEEIRFECDDDKKFQIVKDIQNRLQQEGKMFCNIDGVRCDEKNGWWLIRASNTQPALVARCESISKEGLNMLEQELKSQLKLSGVSYK